MTFFAKTPYVDVEWTISKNKIFGNAIFKDLSNVSAIHIHSNLTNMPILVWLATSREWENGVAQATPLNNSPCCFVNYNNKCSLTAPYNVPNTKYSSFTNFNFCVELNACNPQECDWKTVDFLVNVHGYDFGRVDNGCPNNLEPSAAMIYSLTVPNPN
jgi:hypothetical protein